METGPRFKASSERQEKQVHGGLTKDGMVKEKNPENFFLGVREFFYWSGKDLKSLW